MKDSLILEIVEIYHLSNGYAALVCTPGKFDKRMVTEQNESSIKVGNKPKRKITIAGEDRFVRSDLSKPVEKCSFLTLDDVSWFKDSLGKEEIILSINY